MTTLFGSFSGGYIGVEVFISRVLWLHCMHQENALQSYIMSCNACVHMTRTET